MNRTKVSRGALALTSSTSTVATVVATFGLTWFPALAQPGGVGSASVPLEEIVVTGSRRTGVSALESMSPVDVVTARDLEKVGLANMNDVLRTLVPSLNVQLFMAQDGSAFIRPFSLRGLPPDQTLVLVNGKRRHRSPLVQITNQPLAAGAQGPDLSTIPSIAIERVEVLRDGAAAQYGSDAIAGVVNFRLKQADAGISASARYGQYYEGDGEDVLVQTNLGAPLGEGGFFNVSAEYSNSNATLRGTQRPNAQALIDAGNTAVPVPAQRWGNPELEAARMFFNAEVKATDSATAYAFGNYSWSTGEVDFFYRAPNARPDIFTSVPLTTQVGGPRFSFTSRFPGGFTPLFGSEIRDMSLTGGARGEFSSGLTYDLSAALSLGQLEYRLSNTVNPSLGARSPTRFKPGEIQQRDTNLNADFTYPIELEGLSSPLNLAFGAEYRRETYEIEAGDEASWIAGPFARVFDPDAGRTIGLAVGSSGFPGLSPQSAGSFSRWNWAAYADLEGELTERLTLGLAARFEDYSDFGTSFNWKVSSRFQATDGVAIRGSVNTGFRAPTPGQSNVKEVATNIDLVTGGLLLTVTLPPGDPIAQYYGAKPLRPEDSMNFSGGMVFEFAENYSLTVDYFNIKVEDRIGLTSRITITNADRAALAAQGLSTGDFQTVRFLGNFFDTRTQGVDAVLSANWDIGNETELGLVSSLNYTKNKVTTIRDPRAVDRERRIEVGNFNPKWRGNIAMNVARGRWDSSIRANYFGKWTDAVPNATPTPNAFDQVFGAEWLIDAEVGFQVTDAVRFAVGANNLLDEYPDKDRRLGQQANGIVYPQFSPFGFNGGFYYVRVAANF
ncbi:MAG: TonB-dependent receptor [Rhodospirillaceae bacterium]|nr:TonB-dependent receptor [Rhodospirillaceae bacterium]